jgi:hypothetical protein
MITVPAGKCAYVRGPFTIDLVIIGIMKGYKIGQNGSQPEARRLSLGHETMKKMVHCVVIAAAAVGISSAFGEEISAVALQSAFQANNLRAETKYSGHPYDVTGSFKGAESGLFGGSSTVTISGDNPYEGEAFLGTLADGQSERAMGLNKGDNVRLRCTLGGTVLGTPTGRDCHFVTAVVPTTIMPPTSPDDFNAGKQIGSPIPPPMPANIAHSTNQAMPFYDISAACSDDTDQKGCVSHQYVVRGLVADHWLMIAPEARAECISMNRWHDYEVLWRCVDGHENDARVGIVYPPAHSAVQVMTSSAPEVVVTTQPPAPPVANIGSIDPDFQAFAKGKRDRIGWENFFSGVVGDERDGAFWWTGQRSLKNPGSCSTGHTIEFQHGCEEAQVILGPTDLLRKTSPIYRSGWNSL